ncbi:phosphate ABC transporter permease [Natronobeatus ordinarius]|uniref:phosphate ABC transporter permease n=1 Tax=Natronobeatus ordinarius TaxID=2963433 RepID=UPI0020CDE03A|nr:phosphate ABC transporter permease [Natronobeatus ordinarius]
MIDPAAVGVMLVGVALLFAGATLSSYGVGAVGALLGSAGGYLGAPTVAAMAGLEGAIVPAAGVLVGAGVGIAVTYLLLSVAAAAVSFVVGTFFGLALVAPALVDGTWYLEWGVALLLGALAAIFGLFMTRTAAVLVTSFVGAALASRSVSPSSLEAAQASTSLEPLLFDVGAPLFVGLFALGVLSQVGLFKFGYVTRIVRILPGVSVLRDRGRRKKAGG